MRLIILFSLFLISCAMEYKFQGLNEGKVAGGDSLPPLSPDQPNNSQNNPQPIVDPDVPAALKYSNGECTVQGTEVLSCLTCKLKTVSSSPDLSLKAQQLLMIMGNACKIKNKSDPANKPVVDKEVMFKYLSRASQERYPNTALTTSQAALIKELSSGKPSIYKKLFGGLWYQPPYSDDFETYFGIATQEVKSLFCFETETSGFNLNSFMPLQSKDYIDCLYSDNNFNCKEIPFYIAANQIRQQLQDSIRYSLNNPYMPSEPRPVNKCFWEKVEGIYNQDFETILVNWVNQGYKIGIYFHEGSPRCESFQERASDLKGKITAAAYSCDDFE